MKNAKIFISLLIVPILLLSFSNCGGAQNSGEKIVLEKNPPFKIAEAYYQKWVAGVKEGGRGTNVYINFTDLDTEVSIQEIYFRDKAAPAKENQPLQYVAYFKDANSTDYIMDSDPMKEAQNTPQIPFKLEENEAVIGFMRNGKKHFYKISNLSEREMTAYPQQNPNSHE
ncbi:hypothetical protein QRD02_01970 [Aequorivita sp. SDUM287046]|uniref:Lipoprotein n=1 Tax=Aequorivita aurantiaca TaxID=3053356 RepID=A0ABT8DD63_9FLAO|nr:hypothetical protein [Aequorivita aurantiaca]MDN3723135.1 hypothetical protein [Aequorivita aurantiaca]